MTGHEVRYWLRNPMSWDTATWVAHCDTCGDHAELPKGTDRSNPGAWAIQELARKHSQFTEPMTPREDQS